VLVEALKALLVGDDCLGEELNTPTTRALEVLQESFIRNLAVPTIENVVGEFWGAGNGHDSGDGGLEQARSGRIPNNQLSIQAFKPWVT
jgi:hypothetical protein